MASGRDSDISWVPAPGTVLDNRYRLDEVVDRGGMGMIMRAEHLAMQRQVAVKLVRPDVAASDVALARFQREVGVAARLQHRNIVRCHDSGTAPDGALYLVMELLEGESLKQRLVRAGRLSIREGGAIALQILDGLAAAHLQGVVHRDIKPGNIFIAHDERGHETVKLLDFGLARSVFSVDLQITQTGKICGTTAYLPPETIVTPEPTAAGDVYACGLVMLEMVLGQKVFWSQEIAQSYLQHLGVPARIPRRVWMTPYGTLIAEALRKHPDERPPTADALYARLATVVDSLPDVRLTDDEIPPLPGPQSPDLLHTVVGSGGLDMLRRLPAPVCWGGKGDDPTLPHHMQAAAPVAVPPSEADLGRATPIVELQFDEAVSDRPIEVDLSVMPLQRVVQPPPAKPRRKPRGDNDLLLLLVGVLVVAGVAYWFVWRPEPEPPIGQTTALLAGAAPVTTAGETTAQVEPPPAPQKRQKRKPKKRRTSDEKQLLEQYIRVDE